MIYFYETDKIGLRPLSMKDLDGDYVEWFNDEVVCKNNSHHKYPVTYEELKEWLSSVGADRKKVVFAIYEKERVKHIGNVSLQNIDFINRRAEFAILLGDRESHGKGYGTEIMAIMIGHGFNELGLNSIYAGTSAKNIAFQVIAERVGFKKCGVKRKAMYKEGDFVDIFEYDILREEWIENNRRIM